MADYVTILGSIFFLAFGICSVIAGIFAAYFGSGKSRGIGGALIIVGIIFLGLLYYLMTGYEATKATWNLQLIYDAIVVIIGAGIGAIAALGIFLAVIMKS
jgi:MFS family permease